MHPLANLTDTDVVFDGLPDHVVTSMEVRDKYLTKLGMGGGAGMEFVVEDLLKWLPGQRVRVAFLDGDTALHREVAETIKDITDTCNLRFDFGEDASGNFRRWTENDTDYAAEIRVSFDKVGYFSLVGTDSVNKNIGSPIKRVGGRPYQCSLNLGGFTMGKPPGWRGTILHEFLHALSFHHAHQNMRGPCQEAFRWEDDPDYQPTTDADGRYITDFAGRRPGIYTYLAGYPNYWGKGKVDHNLKAEESPDIVTSGFDRESVMLYRFSDLFYKTNPSSCAPLGNGQALSDGDKRGLQLLYPHTAVDVAAAIEARRTIAAHIAPDSEIMSEAIGAESAGAPTRSQQIEEAVEIFRRNLKTID